MSLIGAPFLDLIVLLTVAGFVGLVVIWPRLHGRQVRVIASRTGLLLTVNLLVLLTATTQLNAHFLFFTSWGDLSGAVGSDTTLSRGASALKTARTTVHSSAAVAGPLPTGVAVGRTRSGGTVYQVHGVRSGLTGQVIVQLPTGYDHSSTARYPVIEAFGGYPGSPEQWVRSIDLAKVITEGVDAHRIRPVLIVSVQTEFPHGVDTECVNGGSGQPQVETWLAQEVPQWVAHTFRVATVRSSWSTMGFSAGGWCAGMIAMLHPAQYASAVVLGGYFRPDFGPFYEPIAPGSSAARRYDLIRLAGRAAPPPIALWLETSHRDRLSYDSSTALLHVVRPPMSVSALVLKHAGHRLSVWKGEMPAIVAWLGADIPGFSPSVRPRRAEARQS